MIPTRFNVRSLRQACITGVVLFASVYLLSRSLVKEHIVQENSLLLGNSPSRQDIDKLCKDHGFTTYIPKPDARPRKVYDMFLISTELDWLEIRLHTLSQFVDHFVVVEGSSTFTGRPKPLYLENNWANFTDYHPKIIHKVVQDPGISLGTSAWAHEDFLRNSLADHVFPDLNETQAPTEGDVLIVSDIDEIPRPETILTLKYCEFPDRLTLRSSFYYYSFQWQHRGRQWQHPQATQYRGKNTILPQDLRSNRGGPGWWIFGYLHRWRQSGELWNAAWHCSSCFATLAEMEAKIRGFSHTNWDTEENRNPDTIVQRVRNGLDLFARWGQDYDRIENNLDVPEYILQHNEKFKYMLNRDGENAAFVDYQPGAAGEVS